MELWHATAEATDVWLHAATEESMQRVFTSYDLVEIEENAGILIVHHIFRSWCHIGEICATPQMLGRQPPEFVDMYGWSYPGTLRSSVVT